MFTKKSTYFLVDDSSGIVVNKTKAIGRVWGNFPACPSVKNGDELGPSQLFCTSCLTCQPVKRVSLAAV